MKTEELERKTQILDQHQQDSQKEAALIVATQLLEENILQYEIDVVTLTNVILFAQQGSIHRRFLNLTQIRETADLYPEQSRKQLSQPQQTRMPYRS